MTSHRPGLWSGLLVVALFGAGAFVCFCSLIVHRHVWLVGGVPVPWGLVLCLATGYFGARAAGLLGAAAGAVAFGLGWIAVFLATYSGRPEGDYLVAADAKGYAYMVGGIALVGLAVGRAVVAPTRGRRDTPPRLRR